MRVNVFTVAKKLTINGFLLRLFRMKLLAQVGLGIKSRNLHHSQKTTDSLGIELRRSVVPKVCRQLAVSPRRVGHMKLVQLPHERQVRRVLAVGQILPLLLVLLQDGMTRNGFDG